MPDYVAFARQTERALRKSREIAAAASSLPMPERVRRIRRAIQQRGNFAVMRDDAAKEAILRYGRSIGMKFPMALLTGWQADFLRRAKPAPPVVDDDESEPDDLGPTPPNWPNDPLAPDKDDDDNDDEEAGEDTEQLTRSCPKCRGLGRDSSGSKCDRCNGSGRIPADSVKEGDKHGLYQFLFE
jgi:hypothetical protein